METAYVKCIFCRMNKPFRSNSYPTGVFEVPPFEGSPGDSAFIMLMEQSAGPGRGRARGGDLVRLRDTLAVVYVCLAVILVRWRYFYGCLLVF